MVYILLHSILQTWPSVNANYLQQTQGNNVGYKYLATEIALAEVIVHSTT